MLGGMLSLCYDLSAIPRRTYVPTCSRIPNPAPHPFVSRGATAGIGWLTTLRFTDSGRVCSRKRTYIESKHLHALALATRRRRVARLRGPGDVAVESGDCGEHLWPFPSI
jgi:hypothetical protein